jgi:hypothetical protein
MEVEKMTFENTADPNVLTCDDIARWCEELGAFIRENSSAPELWSARSDQLQAKIKAACVIMSSVERP